MISHFQSGSSLFHLGSMCRAKIGGLVDGAL